MEGKNKREERDKRRMTDKGKKNKREGRDKRRMKKRRKKRTKRKKQGADPHPRYP